MEGFLSPGFLVRRLGLESGHGGHDLRLEEAVVFVFQWAEHLVSSRGRSLVERRRSTVGFQRHLQGFCEV